jgi:selenide, water dikinase
MKADPTPIHTDIVLVGGGHAHVAVLKMYGMKPEPGVRLTLIARDSFTPYSGMIPGYIAGHYSHAECHIDLGPLCRFANARLIHAEAIGLDPASKTVAVRGRPPLRFDIVSVDIGAATATKSIPGAEEFGLPVKPLDRFLERLAQAEPALPEGARVTVVGGGAGGSELVMALQHRLKALSPQVTLVTDTHDPLPTYSVAVRERLQAAFMKKGIQVLTGRAVSAVTRGALEIADGTTLLSELTVLATGSQPATWLDATGLALDEGGFIAVGEALESVSHPGIFAAGDIASFRPQPLPKAGVYAVRQGPALATNLRRTAGKRTLKPFRPQHRFLSLLSCGGKSAIASYGAVALSGNWVWRWKNSIDQRWMRKYRELPEMQLDAPDAPPTRCAGCGAKISGDVLSSVLARLDLGEAPGLLLGAGDDAAVVEPLPGKVLVQSADQFRAFIADPFLFGRITALHSLSDLYAMGAEPHSALAHATLPFAAPEAVADDLHQLLAGACLELRNAGAALIGGHSSEGPEMAFGLSVNGFADPKALWRKAGAKPGQALVLTKPLGTGALLAADMRGKAKSQWIDAAIASMLTGNAAAVEILRQHHATAATDVTGFGLLGHLREMLAASGCGASLVLNDLPILPGAAEILAAGIESTLAPANRAFLPDAPAILSDPQTAGGLLAAVPSPEAKACVGALRAGGYPAAAIIGRCQSRIGIEWS